MKNKVFTNRYEIKYLLDPLQYKKVKQAFSQFLVPDVNGSYYIQSVYFDSIHYRYYTEKHEGLIFRTKPRLRIYRDNIYDEAKDVFLEFKHKYDRIISKDREKIKLSDALQFLKANYTGCSLNESKVLNKFVYLASKYCLKPSINILYHREAFYSEIFKNLRITFDANIKSSFSVKNFNVSETSFEPIVNPLFKIMEIKYNNSLPLIILRLIENLELEQLTFSKYTSCLDKNYDNVRNLLNHNFNSFKQEMNVKKLQNV